MEFGMFGNLVGFCILAILWCALCLVVVPIANCMTGATSLYEDFKGLYVLSLITVTVIVWIF